MPTISQREVTARKRYLCDEEDCVIWPGDRYMRLFGYAETGDPPMTLRYCMKCWKRLEEERHADH